MLTKDQVLDKLKTVEDPELHINIVDLGLIYKVEVNKAGKVTILMTLTSPGCPLSFLFNDLVTDAVKKIKDVKEVKINLTFDPPWDVSKMTEDAKTELGWLG